MALLDPKDPPTYARPPSKPLEEYSDASGAYGEVNRGQPPDYPDFDSDIYDVGGFAPINRNEISPPKRPPPPPPG